jgi:hypothetical protein
MNGLHTLSLIPLWNYSKTEYWYIFVHMDTKQKGKGKVGWVVLTIVVLFVLTAIAATSGSSSGGTSQAQAPKQPTYSELARTRFDTIASSSPELTDIACENDDCGSSVAYFDYKTIPGDFDSVIRGNAATYSKFGLDNHGISHVTVAARLNGTVFFACNAADGAVTKCDTYSK